MVKSRIKPLGRKRLLQKDELSEYDILSKNSNEQQQQERNHQVCYEAYTKALATEYSYISSTRVQVMVRIYLRRMMKKSHL